MTDNEIIKALKEMSAEYEENFSKHTLDLINRQKEEIKELNAMHKASQRINVDLLRQIKDAKIDAAREFAKRLKEKLWLGSDLLLVDSVLEEMVGDE